MIDVTASFARVLTASSVVSPSIHVLIDAHTHLAGIGRLGEIAGDLSEILHPGVTVSAGFRAIGISPYLHRWM